MGAYAFTEVAFGDSARQAFNAAVEHAQWEHGHGGYTGTIAEKHAFTVIARPRGEELTTSEFAKLVKEASYESQFDDDWIDENVPEAWQPAVRKAVDLYEDKWGPAVAMRLTEAEQEEDRDAWDARGDGPMGFLFFGMASS